jgi:thiol:disulfide interchange protein DsbD
LRLHGLAFALGVLLCFWVVAGALLTLRAGGAALGWGYQLQSPLIVSALAVLFFVLALNLSGLFELGTRVQGLAGAADNRYGYLGSFLSGLLATVVATPCTAPFMGAALGYALTQSVLSSMLVFTALALGMAAPLRRADLFAGVGAPPAAPRPLDGNAEAASRVSAVPDSRVVALGAG